MPFHFCSDELLMILAMIPFIGIFFAKIHNWWHKKFGHKCHEKSCQATHVEHCFMPANIPHGKVGEGQCEDHLYDLISKEDLDEKLGPITDKLMYKLEFDLDLFLKKEDFRWFINEHGDVKATFHGKAFSYDVNVWSEIKQ